MKIVRVVLAIVSMTLSGSGNLTASGHPGSYSKVRPELKGLANELLLQQK